MALACVAKHPPGSPVVLRLGNRVCDSQRHASASKNRDTDAH